MITYFISDIHLHADSAKNSKLLIDFLEQTGPQADAIYILGDLFAVWFGDDLAEAYAQDIITALKKLTEKNIPVYFMRGNRDFLIDQQFCNNSGCKLLADPCVVNIYDKTILLTHGDLLCTADVKYQRFRSVVQNPLIKAFFLSLPKLLRLKIGRWVKNRTSRTSKIKYATVPEILDVIPGSVNNWVEQHKAEYVIHGHTHKPAIHHHNAATRIVLGDWNEKTAQILAFSSHDFKLQDLLSNSSYP